MEKLSMCRVCLVEDIRQHLMVETHLQEMYESLVLMPFETKDRRPIVACHACCAWLQNCYELKKRCLRSEELFTQMLSCAESEPAKLQEIDNEMGHEPQMRVANVDGEALTFYEVKVEKSDLEDNDEDDLEDYNVYDNIQSADSDDDPLINVKEEQSGDRTNIDEGALEENSVYDNIQSADSHDGPLIIVKEEQFGDRTSDIISKRSKEAAQRNPEDLTSSNLKEHELAKDMFKEFNKVTAADKTTAKSSNEDLSRVNSTSSHTHTGQRPHQCHVCEKRFPSMSQLTRHMRTHPGEKLYHCDICKKQFLQKSILTNHMRTHTGEKQHQCHVCKKYCSKPSILIVHMRTHTGEKPYQCYKCEKNFSRKALLKRHLLTHTGEKPYHCHICKKQFSQKNTLTNHMRTHTGEKPYQCNICNNFFSVRGNLTKHIRTHTRKKTLPV